MKAPIVKGTPDPTAKQPAGVSLGVDLIHNKIIISVEGQGSVGLSPHDFATFIDLGLDAMAQLGHFNYYGRKN